jgi:hypothetical protein
MQISPPLAAVWSLALIFGFAGLVQLAGPGFVRRAYRRWDYPPKFYRRAGLAEVLVAALLADPLTRIWGIAIGAIVTWAAVITLLNNRQYVWSIPGIVMLVALAPASLAAGM